MEIRCAYLNPLHGGAVAEIRFRDGSISQLMITKRQAVEIAGAMLGIKIDEFELAVLKDQINRSRLISENTGLEEFCNEMQNQMNTMERELDDVYKTDNLGDDSEEWKNN